MEKANNTFLILAKPDKPTFGIGHASGYKNPEVLLAQHNPQTLDVQLKIRNLLAFPLITAPQKRLSRDFNLQIRHLVCGKKGRTLTNFRVPEIFCIVL